MTVYLLLFAFFALGALLAARPAEGQRRAGFGLLLGGLLLTTVIGLRFEVGADWTAYVRMFRWTSLADLDEAVTKRGDPAYFFVNWIVINIGGGFWLVNVICAAIFTYGLLRLAKMQEEPWLALAIAVPYLAVVMAMGYTRQSAAIGVIMAGYATLIRGGSSLRFILTALVATLFHQSAIVAIPLALLGRGQNRFRNGLLIIAATLLIYNFFLTNALDKISGYIRLDLDSSGAAVRLAMSVLPALVFLRNPSALRLLETEYVLWRNHAWAAIAITVLFFFVPSTTIIDRFALYTAPLQLVVWSRVPGAYFSTMFGRILVLAYSAAVLIVWLNYAAHARYWVPYEFYPTTERPLSGR
jgi:hypothetical protein